MCRLKIQAYSELPTYEIHAAQGKVCVPSNYPHCVPETIIVLAWPNIFISKHGFLGKSERPRSSVHPKMAAIIELMRYSGAYLRKQAWLIFLFDGMN